MMLFPPIGLEYVATSAKGLVDKITLLDLRQEKELFESDKASYKASELNILSNALSLYFTFVNDQKIQKVLWHKQRWIQTEHPFKVSPIGQEKF